MKQRLSKVLAACGVASRRKCEELIFGGKVTVNGEKILLPQTIVDSEQDKILVEGQSVQLQEKKVYYALNKPAGLICTSKEVGARKSVLSLFDEPLRLFTVGRLDKETTGLIFVTNDGHFSNAVIHPSRNISKEYLAKTDKDITDQHLKALDSGGVVEGTWVKPLKVEKVRNTTLKMSVSEGKKREVRKLLEYVGLEVLELRRIRIGSVILGSLKEGAYRTLTPGEKEQLLSLSESLN
jgi:23S rRNA pseudouridine2605 synthase